MSKESDVFDRLIKRGISRRDFMKYCTMTAAVLGLSPTMVPKVAEAITNPARPSVIWLHFAECTGCSEAFLRSTYPSAADIILDTVSVDYHETIMAAAGHQAHEALEAAAKANKGKFILVCEGAIPTADGGVWGKVGGRTFLDLARTYVPQSLVTICVGNCASFGGVQAAAPNPTGAKGVGEAVGIETINLAGCPPNAVNIVATVVHYLLLGKLPALDEQRRPLFAYGKTIHDNCPRRGHYEAGEMVERFGDEGAQKGYCLYQMGCRGPDTYNNCPTVLFNNGANFPIGAGHPCIGCSEPKFWDEMSPFFVEK